MIRDARKIRSSGLRRLGLGLAALAFTAAAAGAQSMDYGSLEELFGGPVTTSATGSPQRASDVPVNMIIVTADEIRRSGAKDIPGVLRHVAGVDVLQWGTDSADVSIRGYDTAFAARTLVLIDGRQVYADYYGFIPWSTLPVELGAIRQIEIVKGPNAALFGFNAAGGVINIITYNPRYDDVNALSTRTGTQGLADVSGVATLRPTPASALRLSAGYSTDSDFSTAVPLAMSAPRGTNDRLAFDALGLIALTDDVELGLEASHSHARVNELSPGYVAQDSLYQTNSLEGRITADTGAGLVKLNVYTNWIAWKGNPSFGLGTFSLKNRVLVAQAEDTFNLGTDHTVRLAFDYRHNTVGTTPLPGGTVSYDVYSLSGMWNWQITPAVSFTNALRVDQLMLDRGGYIPADYPFANADWNRTTDQWSFNSGLVWRATADDTFRVIASRGVQLPSLIESGALLIDTPYLQVTGDPYLKPTTVTNYELTWNRALPDIDAHLEVAAFHQVTTNVISVGGGFIVEPLSVYATPANIGSSRASGVEFSANGELDEAWRWTLSYRLEAVEDRFVPFAEDGIDFVDYEHTTPKNVVKAGLGWSGADWDIDGYFQYQSDSSGLTATMLATALAPVGSYATVDARAAYRLTDWATIAVSGQNLLQSPQRQTSGPRVERQVFVTLSLTE